MRKIFILGSIFFLWTCGGGGGGPTEPEVPAPTASFTASTTIGNQPLEVTFTSTSTGTISSYAWNIDNDTAIEGTTATYVHSYTDAGTYSVTLTVTGPGGSNSLTNQNMIIVTSSAPVITTDPNQNTDEDTSATFTLTATDPNNQSITYAIVDSPSNGTASIDGDQATYTPNANFYGTDSFTYNATNGSYTSDTATITITVAGTDDGDPTTNDISVTTDEDTAVTVNLDATEIDGDNYSFTIITQPANGTLGSVNGNQVEYTPNQDWNGTDTFTFEATDDRTARMNVATATITVNAVNDAPTTNDVSATIDENRTARIVDITLDGSDIEGDALTYSLVTNPSNGTASISGATLTYTANQDWNGTETFTYKANDGTVDSNTANITITVNAVDDAPTTSDQTVTVNEDEVSQITMTGANDVDGDNLTYTVLNISVEGSFSHDGSSDTGTFTPTPNANGDGGTFTYKVNDGTTDSNIATVTIAITAINDAPVTTDIATTIDENRTARMVGITLQGTDVDGDDLTYTVVSGPSNGNASIAGSILTYAANQDWNGTETITYKANDGTVDSNTSTVTITINSVNDAPVTQNVSFTTDEDTPYTESYTAYVSDIEGDNLTITTVTDPTNGTVSCDDATNCTYTPNQDFNGTDSFTYKVNDGELDSNISTVSVTINPVNDAPVAADITETTPYETAINITLSATDVEGSSLTYSIVSDVSNGSTSLSGSTVTYTPTTNWDGTDTFTYKANDGTADSNTATVTITVNADDAPTSSFTADETTGFTPLRVVFTNSSTNSTSYAWDFGDGNTSTDTSPTHTFSTAGTYTVSLTATGSGGSDSSTETITVSALPNSSLITDPKYIINNSTSSFDIKVNQVTNLTSAQLVLNIPAGMSVDAVTAGSFLEGNTAPLMILTDNVSSDGTYSISISSLSSDLQSASGDGTLATVTFTNNNSASSNITFNSNTKFLDNDGNTISINQAIGVFLVTE